MNRWIRIISTIGALALAQGAGASSGACCLPDGGCTNLTAAECDAAGGSFQALHDCADVACPQGACCYPDGSCSFEARIGCEAGGGRFQGAGSDCLTIDCLGACCLPDGGCQATWSDDCAALGGAWVGLGTDCATSECAAGACCLSDESCATMSRAACESAGGVFLRSGGDCAAAACSAVSVDLDCPIGPSERIVAIPLFDDLGGLRRLHRVTVAIGTVASGTASIENGGSLATTVSMMTNASATVAFLDAYSEFEFQNATAPLLLAAATPPLLAGPDAHEWGTSMESAGETIVFDLLEEAPSAFVGPGYGELIVNVAGFAGVASNGQTTFRLSNFGVNARVVVGYEFTRFGACCLCDAGCLLLDEEACAAEGGTWLGVETSCDDADCTCGACCLEDGSCAGDMNESDCLDLGGSFLAGADCAALECGTAEPTGACCLADGSCVESATLEECAALGGALAEDVACADAGCAAPDPTGACCLADGSCFGGTTADECLGVGGVFAVGLPCEAAACVVPDPTGACCLGDGSCVGGMTAKTCASLSGQFSANLDCADVVCEEPDPTGACCLPSGGCAGGTTASQCAALGGEHFVGESCADAPCGDPNGPTLGACCLCEGGCIETDQVECAQRGGRFAPGLDCSEVHCPIELGSCCFGPEIAQNCVDAVTREECENFITGFFTPCGVCGGGCLLPDIVCVIMPRQDCVGNQWRYFGTCTGCGLYQQALGRQGSCCLGDECVRITRDACAMEGGTYFGDGVPCWDDRVDCDFRSVGSRSLTGACCINGWECFDLLEEDCDLLGGTFSGVGSDCPGAGCLTGPAPSVGPLHGYELVVAVLAGWGGCPVDASCPADVTGDGRVDFGDLLVALSEL